MLTHTQQAYTRACESLSRRLILLFFLFSSFVLEAQTGEKSRDCGDPKVYHFLMDGTLLMRDFRNNARMLDDLDSMFDDPEIASRIDSVLVCGAASPIARREYNDSLSLKRAAALKSYIMWKHPQFDRSKIYTLAEGIDWEGFYALVNSDNNLPAGREIKDLLLHNLPKDILLERLRTIGGRTAFDYLVKNIYPKLQYVSVRVRLADRQDMPADIRDTIPVPVETAGRPEETSDSEAQGKRSFLMGVKSNLLYDLVLLPNLSLEFPIGADWSVVVEGNWSWWNFNHPAGDYYRIQAAGLEVRRWFASPAKLKGHAVGLYALGGTYDIRLFSKDNDDTGWLSNWSYSFGLSYAWSLPIARHLNLELGIAAGYLGGRYYDYQFHAGSEHSRWEWQKIRNRNYFGPTRLGVSLVWEFIITDSQSSNH